MNVFSAIKQAIEQEQRDVTLRSSNGRIHGRPHTNAVCMDGVREDCQHVMAMAAALLVDDVMCQVIKDPEYHAEAQLEILNDLQDLLVHHIIPVADDETPMSFIFPNVPFLE